MCHDTRGPRQRDPAESKAELAHDASNKYIATYSPKSRTTRKLNDGVAFILKGLNSLVNGVVALRNSQGVGPHGRDALEHCAIC